MRMDGVPIEATMPETPNAVDKPFGVRLLIEVTRALAAESLFAVTPTTMPIVLAVCKRRPLLDGGGGDGGEKTYTSPIRIVE